MKLVSIIIVNWNGKNDTLVCLGSLAKIDYPGFEVIVVDNGSTDGSIEAIKRLKAADNKLQVIENKKNLGFAQANNIGVAKAKGNYILLLNNDTKVTEKFLTKLVKVLDGDKTVGIVQPKIVFAQSEFEEAGQLQSGGAFLTNTGFLYHLGYGKDPSDSKYNQPMEIFSANGACMLTRKRLIEKLDLFDPDFFAYFEETDFCWRAWLAGYRVVYVPDAVIHHKGKQTTKSLTPNFVNFHSFKNRIATLIKNLGGRSLLLILPLHIFLCQLASLVFLVLGRWQAAVGIQQAILWNIANLRGTWRKRLLVQTKVRKISDGKLLPQVMRPVRLTYYYYLFVGLEGYED